MTERLRWLVRWALLVLAALVLSACVYVPRSTTAYDADCQIKTRQMELQPVEIEIFRGCSSNDCVALLVAAGAVAAASAVVSGSIVVVGNVVYWFEKWGNCRPRS
jgi:hypothetical protein